MNEQDSLHMKGLLSRQGYLETKDDGEADLVLFVTCSIREKAVQKVFSDLGRVRQRLEDNPQLLVGVCGCVAQQEKENLFKRFPFIDLVFGPDAIKNLPEMIAKAKQEKTKNEKVRILNTQFSSQKDFEFINLVNPHEEESRIKAFVNIQKGCDNVCSFCIVPRVRGREVSRPSQEIIQEIKALVGMGVKEVTLLGQNVNSYGLKDRGELQFSELLQEIANQTNLERLRFTTSHPKDVGSDLIKLFGELTILCPSFHLPVQSGSNRVLKDMRRQYTREHYLEIIQQLKEIKSNMAFTTDFIVGFPSETEEEFEETISLLNQVGFDMSFCFAYSERPGTAAARMPDRLSVAEKKHRLDILQTRQKQIALEKNKAREGKVEEVLVESFDALKMNWAGRSRSNKIVHFPQEKESVKEDLTGKYIDVKVIKANHFSLMGEVFNESTGFRRIHSSEGDRTYN
ncbi:MAG: tRNA (N6-isopentenyl adenosine(37)-C2)-methylthiotransferase MiaB [Deltaproteobacteria bacterium RIFCSPLOWO2_12_FULL_40_28]|nr:MAG: tRNA (N6-isopentenyl adenosine(37)-C2)-methylthiotransferase MiaB [Deltaproteobacteria bacterium RIFCSPHIGHO2_02_FULL_40_28]OGQ20499.1 MAG: tRNA (N6-isopentenyl adenosine(37)-C2)-methylthiotransferase MiaB [Deltaproteobacteria bacterium RIFCSPHIGHO2_12_FULL_40_32]OGQ41129.1 MAG: tRNA (N6-isopentenyl adenosine(37)-C2)-methylthiotransferase MiaB [Deltaproteobacteria bacterium RIFCSPLOWO2_02_FULL_40_36]OGQ55109.1 MAG: tRNA (N6-isopentenyl adenosine(37)-C2)-methylthiotransferase MiaB [Deltap